MAEDKKHADQQAGGPAAGAGPAEDLGGQTAGDDEITGGGATGGEGSPRPGEERAGEEAAVWRPDRDRGSLPGDDQGDPA